MVCQTSHASNENNENAKQHKCNNINKQFAQEMIAKQQVTFFKSAAHINAAQVQHVCCC